MAYAVQKLKGRAYRDLQPERPHQKVSLCLAEKIAGLYLGNGREVAHVGVQ